MKLALMCFAALCSLTARAEMPLMPMPAGNPPAGLPAPRPIAQPDLPAFPVEPAEPFELPPTLFDFPGNPPGSLGASAGGRRPAQAPSAPAAVPAPAAPVPAPAGSVIAGACPMSKIFLDVEKDRLFNEALRATENHKKADEQARKIVKEFGAMSDEGERAFFNAFQAYLIADGAIDRYVDYMNGQYAQAMGVCGYTISDADRDRENILKDALNLHD